MWNTVNNRQSQAEAHVAELHGHVEHMLHQLRIVLLSLYFLSSPPAEMHRPVKHQGERGTDPGGSWRRHILNQCSVCF